MLFNNANSHRRVKETFGSEFEWSNRQLPSTGLNNGLVLNRRQAIIWTNADPTHWRMHICGTIYIGGDELSTAVKFTVQSCDCPSAYETPWRLWVLEIKDVLEFKDARTYNSSTQILRYHRPQKLNKIHDNVGFPILMWRFILSMFWPGTKMTSLWHPVLEREHKNETCECMEWHIKKQVAFSMCLHTLAINILC